MSEERDFKTPIFWRISGTTAPPDCASAGRSSGGCLEIGRRLCGRVIYAAPWAALAGIWHDLGKYREGFQRYIRQCSDPDAHIEGRVAGPENAHSAAGALWAQQYLAEVDKRSGPVVARVLAYLIAGHHAGLDNWFGGLHERFSREDTLREGRDALATTIPQPFSNRQPVCPT